MRSGLGVIILTAYELRKINNEIKHLKAKLIVLESKVTKTNAELSLAPASGGVSDKVGDLTTQIVHIKRQISELVILKETEIKRLNNDIFQENCLFMHFALNYSWTKIAMQVGGNNTGDGIRMSCERYRW